VLSTGLVGGGKSGWWRSTAGSVAWCKYRWERKRRSDGMRKRSGDRLQLLCPRVRAWGGGGYGGGARGAAAGTTSRRWRCPNGRWAWSVFLTWLYCSFGSGPNPWFQIFSINSKLFNFEFQINCLSPKLFKLCKGVDLMIRNNFPFLAQLQNPFRF
jgi:hypothetical protein